jgi:polyisoprenoid-binding protein YceI
MVAAIWSTLSMRSSLTLDCSKKGHVSFVFNVRHLGVNTEGPGKFGDASRQDIIAGGGCGYFTHQLGRWFDE